MAKTEKVSNLTRDDLIQAMVGREITQTFPPKRSLGAPCEPMLILKGIRDGHKLYDINLEVPKGMIIGIGGLEGQGQRQLARGLFGIDPFSEGQFILEGEHITVRSPAQAMKRGFAFIPDDRKAEGLILPLSVRENMSLLNFDKISSKGIIRKDEELKEIDRSIARLGIKTSSLELSVQLLSGGNQQKVIFSKWLSKDPKLMILHEPTRGVDVQSKLEIYRLLRELTERGVSILVFTSEMIELIGLSDRIYVMYEGRIMGRLDGEDTTEENIMQLSSGQSLTDRQEGGKDVSRIDV